MVNEVDTLPRPEHGQPGQLAEYNEKSQEYIDEKADSRSIEVAEPEKGEVFNEIREIDIGADGKERPIGE